MSSEMKLWRIAETMRWTGFGLSVVASTVAMVMVWREDHVIGATLMLGWFAGGALFYFSINVHGVERPE